MLLLFDRIFGNRGQQHVYTHPAHVDNTDSNLASWQSIPICFICTMQRGIHTHSAKSILTIDLKFNFVNTRSPRGEFGIQGEIYFIAPPRAVIVILSNVYNTYCNSAAVAVRDASVIPTGEPSSMVEEP